MFKNPEEGEKALSIVRKAAYAGRKGPGLFERSGRQGSVSTEEKWLPARNDCLQRGCSEEVTVAWGNFSKLVVMDLMLGLMWNGKS